MSKSVSKRTKSTCLWNMVIEKACSSFKISDLRNYLRELNDYILLYPLIQFFSDKFILGFYARLLRNSSYAPRDFPANATSLLNLLYPSNAVSTRGISDTNKSEGVLNNCNRLNSANHNSPCTFYWTVVNALIHYWLWDYGAAASCRAFSAQWYKDINEILFPVSPWTSLKTYPRSPTF